MCVHIHTWTHTHTHEHIDIRGAKAIYFDPKCCEFIYNKSCLSLIRVIRATSRVYILFSEIYVRGAEVITARNRCAEISRMTKLKLEFSRLYGLSRERYG